MHTKLIAGLLTAMFMLPLVACKKVKHMQTTVVKDCTGVYLNLNGKDYHVCNREVLDGYQNGTKVTATFRHIPICKGTAKDDIVCMMLHENEGWVEVLRVGK